ncbi:MAG TPA: cupin domain-containing protein [Planctomycetaceae bacterium]|jgi:anti-sigma factor ChrR (cupin superfamily)|nr:cupin domain-containing protein [Planctomycetaceae bacterium]
MYQIKVRTTDLSWTDLGMPGVSMKVLHKEAATGFMVVLTRMEAGATIPAHWHSAADETVYVVAGDFVEDGVSYPPGCYFSGKAGTLHGPHSTVAGCVVLTHFSAELDFQTGPLPPAA